jgi:2-polyprenyl-3-methyl-5-hydroxy-6-metoxy-1,4-benzoquinol methylase
MSDVAHWERRYREGDSPWDTGRPSTELQRVLAEEEIAPCRCIELGCGTGSNAVWLAQQGFDVSAVDISPLAIDRATARAAAAGVTVRWLTADMLNPPDLGGPYRFFFDRGCYHVVRRTDVQRFLQTLDRLTEPGTLGLVLTANAREPHDPGPPVVEEATLRQELGQVFQIVWLREFRFDSTPGSGEGFLGWSCVLRR